MSAHSFSPLASFDRVRNAFLVLSEPRLTFTSSLLMKSVGRHIELRMREGCFESRPMTVYRSLLTADGSRP